MKQKQETIEYKKALVYCRVSSERQVKEGHGLESQEQRCIMRADEMGLQVTKVFKDPGVSGGLLERPAMQAMISYMDEYPKERFVIIFDDLKRFARDVLVHMQLKIELAIKRKARLECLNFKFDDTSGGRFVELVMMGAAQLEREQNTEQVQNKMRARLDVGYYPFCPPPGLKHVNKELVLDQPLAGIYKQAIEKYRDYQLNTLEQVADYINTQYKILDVKRQPISVNGADHILRNPVYAGYVICNKWDTGLIVGKHSGFISKETYDLVQQRLQGRAKPRIRKDCSSDFPLRGYLLCSFCHKRMTGSWHAGKNKNISYPHYWCKNKQCAKYSKVILRENIHKELLDLLNAIQPRPEVLKIIEITIKDIWSNRQKLEQEKRVGILKEVRSLESEIVILSAQIRKTHRPAVREQWEQELEALIIKKTALMAEANKTIYHNGELGVATERVFEYVKLPAKAWETGKLEERQLLLNMYFERGIAYNRETGLVTPELPLVLQLSTQKIDQNNTMVERIGMRGKL